MNLTAISETWLNNSNESEPETGKVFIATRWDVADLDDQTQSFFHASPVGAKGAENMMCSLKALTVGLAVAVSATTPGAELAAETPRGFEVNGFVQGMHSNEAKELARRKGFEFHKTDSGAIISKGGRADPVLFCRDELVRYSYTTHGGFMKFLREIRSFEGQGYRRTNLDLGTQMGSDGKEFGHLTIYFFRPGDNYFATITLLGTEDYDTDNFAIGYEALDKVAKCQ